MRFRAGALVGLVVAGLVLAAGPALAAPPAPQVRCELDDDRVAEASGLVAGPDEVVVVNDSGNPSTLHRLDDDCDVVGEIPVERDGRDVEDLARGADGTYWIADIGDNRRVRESVAVLRLRPDGSQVDVPLVYPDGAHDAEALILPVDERPVIVTKNPGGRSAVYTTDAPLPASAPADGAPVPLRRVGDVVVPPTVTANGGAGAAALLGGGLITGGALSADGRVAALRTYTDAWLYPVEGVADADAVIAALRGAPLQVPLPGEPQGEAIAFEPDGTLLSVSESPDEVGPAAVTERGALRAVPGAASLATTAPGSTSPPAPPLSQPPPGSTSPAEPGPDSSGLGVWAWTGIAVAVMAGGAGVLWASRRERR